jgi:hypothetical protein
MLAGFDAVPDDAVNVAGGCRSARDDAVGVDGVESGLLQSLKIVLQCLSWR